MNLRKLEKRDVSSVVSLIRGIMNKEYKSLKNVYPEKDLENIDVSYGGKREIFFVASDDNDKPIGTIAVKEDEPKTALIRRLFVLPSQRGKGIGSLLVDKALDFCAQNKYKKAMFRSTANMQSANALLLKKKFKKSLDLFFQDTELLIFVKSIK